MYVCMYVRVYIYIYIYVRMYVCLQTYMHMAALRDHPGLPGRLADSEAVGQVASYRFVPCVAQCQR